MTKGILHKLSPRKAVTITTPGRHSDGGNLYLSISPNGARSWTFFYRAPNGKRREMGLGSAQPGGVTLAEARQLAANARALLARRLDPLEHKRGSYLPPVLADDQLVVPATPNGSATSTMFFVIWISAYEGVGSPER